MPPSCKIYQVNCISKNDHIGEAERNLIARWGKYNNPTHVVQHFIINLNHSFILFIFTKACSSKWTLKKFEAIYIALKNKS